MFWTVFENLCRQKGESPNSVAKHLTITSGTVSGWKIGRMPQNATLKKIADYFNVSTDFLLYGKEKSPSEISDEDLKFALFGGDGEITDEMFEEVKRFAEFVKEKHKKNS